MNCVGGRGTVYVESLQTLIEFDPAIFNDHVLVISNENSATIIPKENVRYKKKFANIKRTTIGFAYEPPCNALRKSPPRSLDSSRSTNDTHTEHTTPVICDTKTIPPPHTPVASDVDPNIPDTSEPHATPPAIPDDTNPGESSSSATAPDIEDSSSCDSMDSDPDYNDSASSKASSDDDFMDTPLSGAAIKNKTPTRKTKHIDADKVMRETITSNALVKRTGPRFCLQTAGDSIAPMEFVGDYENEGKFGPWTVSGLKKAVNSGITAHDWQVSMIQSAIDRYRGHDIVFRSYGFLWWVFMGLGKTAVALVFIELTRHLPMPRLRYPTKHENAFESASRMNGLSGRDLKVAKLGMTGNKNVEKLVMTANCIAAEKKRAHALVIIPKSTIKSWIDDIKNFFTAGTFNVVDLINDDAQYKNKNKHRLSRELATTDIVIINYEKLQAISRRFGKKTVLTRQEITKIDLSEGILPLFDYTFNVIILDEAHVVRKFNTVTARSMDLLNAHAWIVMTGTPVVNNIDCMRKMFDHAQIYGTFVNNDQTFMKCFSKWQAYEKENVTKKFYSILENELKAKTVAVPGGGGNDWIKKDMKSIEETLFSDTSISQFPSWFVINDYSEYIGDFALFYTNHPVFVKAITDSESQISAHSYNWNFSTFWRDYAYFASGSADDSQFLTNEKPFLTPGAFSARPDHVALSSLASSGSSVVENLKSSIVSLEKLIKDECASMRAVLQSSVESKKRQLKEEEDKLSQNISETRRIWSDWWLEENKMVLSAYASRREIERLVMRKKLADDKDDIDLFTEPLVFSRTTALAYLWWKWTTNDMFRQALEDAKESSNASCVKLVPLSTDPIERAIENPIGAVMENATLRYGRSTLKAHLLEAEVAKTKERVNGRCLTSHEMDKIMTTVDNMSGVRMCEIMVPFSTDEERAIYDMVKNQTMSTMRDADSADFEGAKKFSFVFQMIMWLRQAAIDARIIGRSAEEMKETMIFDQCDMDGTISKKKRQAIMDMDIETAFLSRAGVSQRDMGRDNRDFWIDLRAKAKALQHHTKLDKLCDLLTNEKTFQSDSKGLVFTFFQSFIPLIKKRVEGIFGAGSVAVIHGQVRDRMEQIDKFRDDARVRIMILSLTSGNMGLNLQVADKVFFMDPWWNPQIESQAICRANRPGQKRVVDVYLIILVDTVEENVQKIKKRKEALADAILGDMNNPYVLPSAEKMAENSNTMSTEEILNILQISDTRIRQKFIKSKSKSKSRSRRISPVDERIPTKRKRRESDHAPYPHTGSGASSEREIDERALALVTDLLSKKRRS